MTKDTIPEVFIIESLSPDDVANERKEGDLIARILLTGGRNPEYRYVESREQFDEAIRNFADGNYRYLHISSHGAEDHFLFHFDVMDFNRFGSSVRHLLENKRVFVSACETVNHENHELANVILRDTGCYSLIGSAEPINFDDAAMFWSTFYYLAYQNQDEEITIKRDLIVQLLKKLTDLYPVEMNYYSFSQRQGIKLDRFAAGKRHKL
jgi:hypothetical protein